MKKHLSLLLPALSFLFLFTFAIPVFASESFTNSDTGYEAVIEDQAQLFTSDESLEVLEKMKPVTSYGNVALVTTDYHYGNTVEFAREKGQSLLSPNGTLLLIDMQYRKIYIISTGKVWKTITDSYATTITDNIYTYASRGEYDLCAINAFDQIYTLLEGGRIAQPLRIISSILLSLLAALLLNYWLVSLTRKKNRPSAVPAAMSITVPLLSAISIIVTKRVKRSSESSGGHGGGGGFSGGGGGGFSGGGGGHSF